MKKLLVLVAMVTLAAPVAFAGKSSGCGLGSQLFAGQSGLVMNVLAATTNGISGNQTFGITTGTSGCDGNDTVYNQQMQEEFVATNMEVLAEEMAQGNGQYVSALAELMGCDVAAQAEFGSMTQSRYETIFSASDQEAKALLGTLKSEISKDALLSSSCKRVS